MSEGGRRKRALAEARSADPRTAIREEPSRALGRFAGAFTVGALALIAHATVLGNGFVYDDAPTLVQARSSTLASCLVSGRGLTYLFHRFDLRMWGDWPPGFHLTNLLLHTIASVLAYFGAFVFTRSKRTAWIAGTLFAVHPAHVEAVASLANRKDVLAAIFVLSAYLCWFSIKNAWARSAATALAFAAALWSKEVAAIGLAVMLPLAEALLGQSQRARDLSARVLACLVPLGVLTVGALWTFVRGVRDVFSVTSIQTNVDPRLDGYSAVVATALASLPSAGRLLVFPTTLSAEYTTIVEQSVLALRPLAGAALVAGWVAACAWLLPRRRDVVVAMAWVPIMYVACSNVVPLTKFFVAERYLYVPSFGICMLAAIALDTWIASSKTGGSRTPAVVTGLLIAALGVRCAVRNRDWADDLTLWSAAVRSGADTYRAHTNLGNALMRANRIEEAVVAYRAAVRWNPEGNSNLAVALARSGAGEEALAVPRAALARNPSDARARAALATSLAAQGKLAEAAEEYRQTLRIVPDRVDLHGALGIVLARQGDWNASVGEFERALEIDPRSEDSWINLGNSLRQLGRDREAVDAYRHALRIRESADALANLASLLASSAVPEARDDAEALRSAQRAVELDGERNPAYRITLARAQAAAGDLEQAAATAREGASLARTRGNAPAATALEGLVRDYESVSDSRSRPKAR